MESDRSPVEALAVVERATAAIWTDYPQTPPWYYPAVGAWVTALVAGLAVIDDPFLQLPVVLALVGLAVGFSRWYLAYRGALPRLTSAPAEFKPAIRAFFAGYAALAGAVVVVTFVLDLIVPGLVLAFAGVTAGLVAYERLYESAAARTRERLG